MPAEPEGTSYTLTPRSLRRPALTRLPREACSRHSMVRDSTAVLSAERPFSEAQWSWSTRDRSPLFLYGVAERVKSALGQSPHLCVRLCTAVLTIDTAL